MSPTIELGSSNRLMATEEAKVDSETVTVGTHTLFYRMLFLRILRTTS